KTSASSTARTSAAGRTDAPSPVSLGSGVSSNDPPSGGGRARHGRPGLRPQRPEYADGAEQAALIDLDPLQADQLEQGEEGQDHAALVSSLANSSRNSSDCPSRSMSSSSSMRSSTLLPSCSTSWARSVFRRSSSSLNAPMRS